jgi:hypothetical protein
MSHLIESYSLQTGAKISKPFIIKNFYPTPDKYITIHNSSGMDGKNYDYFQEVIDHILPYLNKKSIKILQIGGQDDRALNGCVHLHGKTSYHQTAFIIQNSLLHIGNDSFPVHIASAADIPIISLYSVTLPSIAGPCFNSKDVFDYKVFCFTPDFNGKKPSFNPKENPKLINEIKIENIIEAIDKVLDIAFDKKIKTVFIGEKYKVQAIEIVPDSIIRPDFAQGLPALLRIDLLKSEVNDAIIYHNLKSRKLGIRMTNLKKINDLNVLLANKENIIEIIFDINDGYDKKYLESIVRLGIKPIIYFSKENDDCLNKAKLDLMDLNLKFIKDQSFSEKFKKFKNAIEKTQKENLWMQTHRVILSNGKVYLSETHFKEDKTTSDKKIKLNSLTNISNMSIPDIDFLLIYEEIKK